MLTPSHASESHPYQSLLILLPLAWMLGIGFGGLHMVPAWFGWVTLALGLGVLGAELFLKTRREWLLLSLAWVAFALGLLWMQTMGFSPGPQDIGWQGEHPRAVVTGEVVATGNSPQKWILAATRLGNRPVTGQVLLQAQTPLRLGQTVEVKGRLFSPDGAHYPGGFDYQAYLKHQHITMRLSARQVTVLKAQPHHPWGQVLYTADTLRGRMTNTFRKSMTPPSGDILASMVLGEHAVGLDEDVKNAFQHAGLIHLLAASGMNVALVAGLFLLILKPCPLPWRLKTLLAMGGVAFYMVLTGLPPSVQRAGTMLQLAFALKLLRHQLPPLALLCLSGAILSLINPDVVMLTGFQLSFISAFGLLALMPPLQARLGHHITPWLAGALLAPLIAQIWVTPILWSQFGQVQGLALPANLVALPVVAVLTYLGFALGGLAMGVPTASGWVLPWLSPVVLWIYQVAQFFANLPGSQWSLPHPPLPLSLWVLAGLFVWAWGVSQNVQITPRQWGLGLGVWLLGILLPFSWLKLQTQNQTQLLRIQSPSAQVAWILIPPSQGTVVITQSLSRSLMWDITGVLKSQGLTHIDTLVLTAPPRTTEEAWQEWEQALPFRQLAFASHWPQSTQAQWAQRALKGNHSLALLHTTHVAPLASGSLSLYSQPQSPTVAMLTGRRCLLFSTQFIPSPLETQLAQGCTALMTQAPDASFARWWLAGP